MELQHVNVKLLLHNSEETHLEPLIPIFHSWIQDRVCEELLVDVADYRHVHAGPGIVLIGHEANYSVDSTDHRLGLRYNRKAALAGTNQDRFRQAARAALNALERLETDPRLAGKLRFQGQELELFLNDRLLAPNDEPTRAAVEPELRAFCRQLFGGMDYALEFDRDPRRLLSARIKASRPFATADLLRNLA
jgi:hypothetical protein